MAKYFEHEESFRCNYCDIEARRSEFYDDCHVLRCPNCGDKAFHKRESCKGNKLKHEYDHTALVTLNPVYGILKFCYMGYGEKDLPEISIEEDRWEPGFCSDCDEAVMVHTTKVFDGPDSVGITMPYRMKGLDIIPGGESVIFPFSSNHRLFIDGIEQDITVLYSEKDKLWEYFV